jgi:hypothetical protein
MKIRNIAAALLLALACLLACTAPTAGVDAGASGGAPAASARKLGAAPVVVTPPTKLRASDLSGTQTDGFVATLSGGVPTWLAVPGTTSSSAVVSIVNPVGATSVVALTLPAYFLIEGVFLVPTETPVGGTSTLSVGTSGGASDLISGITTGGIGYAAGITLTQLGTGLPSADGYRMLTTASTDIYLTQVQTVAACTAGAYAVVVHGQVLR